MRKNLTLISLNIFLPLTVGLCIYLLFYKGTYINSVLGISLDLQAKTFLGIILKSWVCDFLWAYSLANALYFCLFAFEKKILISAILSIVFATAFELFQLFGIVVGTFDILDIIFQIVAVLIAVTLIKRRERLWKNFYQ